MQQPMFMTRKLSRLCPCVLGWGSIHCIVSATRIAHLQWTPAAPLDESGAMSRCKFVHEVWCVRFSAWLARSKWPMLAHRSGIIVCLGLITQM